MTSTRILPPTDENISLAAELIKSGRLVAFPTETVYGLGANALCESAVSSIFVAKGRPQDNPLIVHIYSLDAAEPLCHITDTARLLAGRFWPGPMTLILKKKPVIPPCVNGGLPSVAIRVPSHPVARALLKACELPIAAPSANLSGRPSPTTPEHVFSDMNRRIPVILDGGACEVGLESTVIDLTGDVPTVLRPGGVTPDMLLTVIDEVSVSGSVMRPLKEGEQALSPGMRYRHYAPKGRLTLITGSERSVISLMKRSYDEALGRGASPRILCFSEHVADMGERRCVSIGERSKPETVAAGLFAVLRRMDDEGADEIFAESPPPNGVGLAVMNRLLRAAAFLMINADEGMSNE